MNAPLGRLIVVVALMATVVTSIRAQVIEFHATLSPDQETSTVNSAAKGSALLLYDVATNTFDLYVTLTDFAAPLTASHIHEGAVGVAGPVVTNFGSESVYVRNGNTLTGVFRNVVHGGNKLTLLQNGAYLNYHTSAYPAGEIRGQLIAQPKRLAAIITPSQEVAATPIVSSAFGGALMSYNPGTNRVLLQVTLFGFTNTLTASHYHEAQVGVNGPVVTNLGGAIAYKVSNGFITQTFDLPYTGDPIKLLTGGAYLNFHSNVYGGGEIRGQVTAQDESPSSRLINASARGFAGTGNQALISGLIVTGAEPVAVRIIARGPSLAAYGVQGVLADPMITFHGGNGSLLASNDNHSLVAPSVIPTLLDPKEAVLDVILPPGAYSVVVTGAGSSTGVALVETFEQRRGPDNTLALADGRQHQPLMLASGGGPSVQEASASTKPSHRPAPEWCVLPSPLVASVK